MSKNVVKNANQSLADSQSKQVKKDDKMKKPEQKPGSSQSHSEKPDDHSRPSQSPRTGKS